MKKFVVTAWTLSEGQSIWLRQDGEDRVWETSFDKATIFDDKVAALARVESAAADVASFLIVDPYEVLVIEAEDGSWQPDGQREQIRALGEPTIPWGNDAVKHIFTGQEKAA